MTAEEWRVIRRKRKTCRFFAADRSGPKPNRRRSGSCPKRRTSLLRSGLLQTWIEPTFLRLQIDSDRFALLIVRSFLLFCCGEGTATHNLQRKVKIIFYFFCKNRPIPAAFFFMCFFSTDKSKRVEHKILPVTGFEPRISGIGSDRSANWATTTDPFIFFSSSHFFLILTDLRTKRE